MGGQRHVLAALPPEKTRYPLYRRLGGPQRRSGQVRKISPPPGFDARTVQPVASYRGSRTPELILMYISSFTGINTIVLRHRAVQVSKSGYEQTSISQLQLERKMRAPVRNITE